MNSQDRQQIADIIAQVKTSGEPRIIELEKFGMLLFRNVYNEATIAGLKITILERGKVFQIERP